MYERNIIGNNNHKSKRKTKLNSGAVDDEEDDENDEKNDQSDEEVDQSRRRKRGNKGAHLVQGYNKVKLNSVPNHALNFNTNNLLHAQEF